MIVGRCYAQSGHITHGLGMLDAIRMHCIERGDGYLAAQAGEAIGSVMLDIRRISDAIKYLTSSVEEAIREHNKWIHIWGTLNLAYAYYLAEDNKRCIVHLHEFIQHSQKAHVIVPDFPYLLELCWAMEQKKLPFVPGISFEKELNKMISSKNTFVKGVAYRYKAFFLRKKGFPFGKILESLKISLKLLEESGHQIEVVRSMLELIRQYVNIGYEKKAKKMTLTASRILSSFSTALIPDDLRSLTKYSDGQSLLSEVLKIGQEVVTIRDNKDLFQHIIASVNRIAGAERGAMFLLDHKFNPPQFQLTATKNLTASQINDPSFQSSMKLIKEVSITGKGRVVETNLAGNINDSSDLILSRICVPMILKDKIIGLLYHDNRLLSNAFKESDLDLLAYFAALAAFALDNANAYEEIQRLNHKLTEEKLYYEEQHLQSIHFEEIVGNSPAIMKVLAQAEQVASTETTVLILGETGVGKELVARAVHRRSGRHNKPFIRVDCSALLESLIPSELFGHEKGSFTGAVNRRIGRFELADGGTIFIDEVGNLPLEVQVRLLRVIQTKEFERIGGNQTLHSDFRLIAATNRNLEKEVQEGRYRADLYYRINVFPIYVPPLRERKEDIPLLLYYFLRIYSKKMGKSIENISKAEMNKLIEYDWPGNVRELENVVERGTILSQAPYFKVPELNVENLKFAQREVSLTLRDNERLCIIGALQKTGWKVRGPGGTAELLGIHPSTLESRMKKLGIQRPKGIPKERKTLTSSSMW
jgi:transcriptional regulator with GAF, ATPase, and Fis domain